MNNNDEILAELGHRITAYKDAFHKWGEAHRPPDDEEEYELARRRFLELRWLPLHAELRDLEQRCAVERWPLPIRHRLGALRRQLGGRRWVEDSNHQRGLLTCRHCGRHCGGGMSLVELFVLNHRDRTRMLTNIIPEDPSDGEHGEHGVALNVIADEEYASSFYPDDDDAQGVELHLWCRHCDQSSLFEIRFELGLTRFYW